jgi:hypothetical protein
MITDRNEILETTPTFFEILYTSRLTEIEKRELEPDLITTDEEIDEIDLGELEFALVSLKNQKTFSFLFLDIIFSFLFFST